MRRFITLLFLLLIWMSGFNAAAQTFPVQIQTILTPPMPEKYAQLMDRPDFMTLVVQNTSTKKLKIKFRMELDGNNGIKVLLPASMQPTNPLALGSMEVRTLSLADISGMYNGLSENDLQVTGIRIADLTKSQRIPDGNYILCVSAFDAVTGAPLSGGSPMGCSNSLITTSVEPPVILAPEDGEEVTALQSQFLTLRWTPVQAPGAVILYDIKIVEVPRGINPYKAVQSGKFTFYEQKSYPASVYVIGPQVPTMTSGTDYAIQIRARDINGSTNIGNDGRSDVVKFTYTGLPFEDVFETDFMCGSPCTPPDVQSGPDIAQVDPGELIQIGHFRIRVQEISKSGNSFSGSGALLRSSFFHAPIRVEFNNVRINRDKYIYSGTASALQEQPMLDLASFNAATGFTPTDHEDNAEIYDVLFNPITAITENMADYLDPESTDGVALPASHGTGDRRIVITGLELTPSRATMDMITLIESPLEMSGERKFLAFGASDLCVSPGGYTTGADPMRLNMLNSIDIEPNIQYSLHFTAGEGDRGCYADIDCDGLQEVHLGGYMVFNEEHVVPANAAGEIISGKRFGAGFQISMEEWGQWMTQLELGDREIDPDVILSNQFQFVGLDDYIFRLNDVWLDQSVDENPTGIAFPPAYPSGGNSWQGFFAQEFEIVLPDYFKNGDDQRISFTAENLIIDGRGLSVEINGQNIMVEDEPGKLDEWDFSIEEMRISIVSNRFRSGSMSGIIKPEIFETAMPYTASMTWVRTRMDYDFSVSMGRNLEVPMWEATMNLDRTSTIRVRIEDGEPELSAVLNGELSLNSSIDGIEGIDIKGLRFENLRLSNSGPRITGGQFNLEAGIRKNIAGFDITLDEVGFGSSGGVGGREPRSFLRFDLGFAFGENENGFNASGGFEIAAHRPRATGEWEFEGLSMNMIEVEGSTSAVSFHALMEWYKSDPVYGNGFRGAGDATFMDAYGLRAEIIFGSKSNYDYWFVDGAALFNPPIPLVGIFGLNAFGGGAYYNMRPRSTDTFESIGNVNRRASYIPSRNGWGFKAMAGIATSDGNLLSGQATIETSFGSGGSLQNIRLDGDFSMLKPPETGGMSNGQSMITLQGTINYNHIGRALDADLGYRVIIPTTSPFIRGERLNPRVVKLHFSPSHWFVYLGSPGPAHDPFSSMVNLNIGFEAKTFGRLGFDINSYFDMGNRLPSPPPLPPQITGSLRNLNFMPSVAGASGVMAGLHAGFSIPESEAFTIWGFGVKVGAAAGMGLDMAFRHLPAISCAGQSDFGINNWYAEARGYLYGNATAKGSIRWAEFNILSVSFQSALMAQLPNPSSLRGGIRASIDLPIYGDYNMNVGFSVGSSCDMETDENFTEDLAIQNLIEDFYFTEIVDSVYAYVPGTHLVAKFNMPITREQEYSLAGGDVLKTRIKWEVILSEKTSANSSRVYLRFEGSPNGFTRSEDPIRTSPNSSRNEIRVYFQDGERKAILRPGTWYDIRMRATLMMSTNGTPWVPLENANGQRVTQSKHLTFHTKQELPPKIRDILSIAPGFNEPFVHMGDLTNNMGFVEFENENLWDRWGRNPRIRVHFTDRKTGEEFFTTGNKSGNNRITYRLPNLRTRRIYKIQYEVASSEPGSKYSSILTYHFKTSFYNTLREKQEDIRVEYDLMNSSTAAYTYFKLRLRCKEPFSEDELPETLSYVNYRMSLTNELTAWHTYRTNMVNYAVRNGIRMSGLSTEFVFLPVLSNIEGKLTPTNIASKLRDPMNSLAFLNRPPGYDDVLSYFWMPNHFARSLRIRILANSDLKTGAVYQTVGRNYQPLARVLGSVRLNMMSSRVIPISFTMRNAVRRGK